MQCAACELVSKIGDVQLLAVRTRASIAASAPKAMRFADWPEFVRPLLRVVEKEPGLCDDFEALRECAWQVCRMNHPARVAPFKALWLVLTSVKCSTSDKSVLFVRWPGNDRLVDDECDVALLTALTKYFRLRAQSFSAFERDLVRSSFFLERLVQSHSADSGFGHLLRCCQALLFDIQCAVVVFSHTKTEKGLTQLLMHQ